MKPSPSPPRDPLSVTRRSFLKNLGTTAVAGAATGAETIAQELEAANAEKVHGPGPVPMTLRVNGGTLELELEPRVTLLEALRDQAALTGSKEVCDRGTCGGCTVLLDGAPVYSCMTLAIEAQGHEITTVEGLAQDGSLSVVQQAFVDKDSMMCGYCTPGFVMGVTALLKRNPHPTPEEIRQACAGNLCRCGTYPRILQGALRASGVDVMSKTEVIPYATVA